VCGEPSDINLSDGKVDTVSLCSSRVLRLDKWVPVSNVTVTDRRQ